MSELESKGPGTIYWVVAAVALLWNLLGMWAYYSNVTATPETLASLYNEEQIALILSSPKWVTSATALAVTGGVIGSILLLLRNKLAVAFFVVSLLSLVVQDIFVFGMTESVAVFGMQPVYLQSLVLLLAVFFTWYAIRQKKKGVIS
tara:strand:+ start:740 stop:1180 length:441 start_codon:yes stop_codon:yes gene_type:complete